MLCDEAQPPSATIAIAVPGGDALHTVRFHAPEDALAFEVQLCRTILSSALQDSHNTAHRFGVQIHPTIVTALRSRFNPARCLDLGRCKPMLGEGRKGLTRTKLSGLKPVNGAATMRRLMGHTSGIRDVLSVTMAVHGVNRPVTDRQMLDYYRTIEDVDFNPGERGAITTAPMCHFFEWLAGDLLDRRRQQSVVTLSIDNNMQLMSVDGGTAMPVSPDAEGRLQLPDAARYLQQCIRLDGDRLVFCDFGNESVLSEIKPDSEAKLDDRAGDYRSDALSATSFLQVATVYPSPSIASAMAKPRWSGRARTPQARLVLHARGEPESICA